MKPQIEFSDFEKIDIRCGEIIKVEDFPRAHNPSWKLHIDFGNTIGIKTSSAQIKSYTQEELLGLYVICITNFKPRNIAGFSSEVLVLGVTDKEGNVKILSPLTKNTPSLKGGIIS